MYKTNQKNKGVRNNNSLTCSPFCREEENVLLCSCLCYCCCLLRFRLFSCSLSLSTAYDAELCTVAAPHWIPRTATNRIDLVHTAGTVWSPRHRRPEAHWAGPTVRNRAAEAVGQRGQRRLAQQPPYRWSRWTLMSDRGRQCGQLRSQQRHLQQWQPFAGTSKAAEVLRAYQRRLGGPLRRALVVVRHVQPVPVRALARCCNTKTKTELFIMYINISCMWWCCCCYCCHALELCTLHTVHLRRFPCLSVLRLRNELRQREISRSLCTFHIVSFTIVKPLRQIENFLYYCNNLHCWKQVWPPTHAYVFYVSIPLSFVQLEISYVMQVKIKLAAYRLADGGGLAERPRRTILLIFLYLFRCRKLQVI